jgi:hypothetical protein
VRKKKGGLYETTTCTNCSVDGVYGESCKWGNILGLSEKENVKKKIDFQL